MSSEATVLYDAPGPKAKRRNLMLSILTMVIVAALAALIIWRLAEAGQFSARKWSVFTLPAAWNLLFEGWLATLRAFVVAAIGALALGLVLAMGRLSVHKWISIPVTWITEFFRAIPVLIFMMLMYYGLPTIGISMTPYVAVVTALILYNGSVLAEVFRAGIQALPKGQSEAGYAIGLRKSQVMTSILLPQAIRNMLPVIIAQLVVALKDTALGFIITYEELLYAIRQFFRLSAYENPIIPAALVGGTIYIATCLVLSGFAVWLERRLRRSKKTIEAPVPVEAIQDGRAV
ncbi:amino acid ABC transporter permease [Haematomicrobium sanguinis]|uniref:amino acid ABC transporter permease n=1 Tax=Haematomicrobium sanguinis TaxID=479106 RepID=UPI00068A41E3|nr:amino acid ABC transporter permease [Haematomicrobium sanguinis]